MEYRRVFFLSLIFLFLNLFAGKIYAQENGAVLSNAETEEDKNYYITQDENNKAKIIQKLSWQKIPDIKNYKIEIQKYQDEEYTTIFETALNENFIEVSLEPGRYRFRVSVIDLFDKEKKSAWENLEILKALLPQINSIEPKTININSKEKGVFTVNGENLLRQTSFRMHRLGKGKTIEEILEGKIISVDEENKMVQVQFESEKIVAGEYEIFALNPGGLYDTSDTIEAKKKLFGNFHLQLSGGYAPPIAFYDGTLEKYMESKFSLLSAKGRVIGLVPVGNIGSFGIGLNANYSFLYADTDVYKLTGNFLTAMGTLVYQKSFASDKLVFDLHGGAGVSFLLGTKFDYKFAAFTSPSFDGMGLAFGGGFAVQYYPGEKKRFFVEAGADFIHTKFADMNYGAVYPSICVGGMF